MPVHAIRGAITIDNDTAEQIHIHTTTLLEQLYERNGLTHDDVVSAIFTATPDVSSAPPAVAGRLFGMTEIPLICVQEMAVDGALGMCVRVMLHIESDRPRSALRHCFLRGATVLRPDLAGDIE
ncbi:MAG: chorismate mutase [Acidimicrobiales bacterium]